MAEISANAVKELREKTGAGMMDCKKALTEAGGDAAKAEELLRKKGLAAAAKKSARAATEGAVQSYIHMESLPEEPGIIGVVDAGDRARYIEHGFCQEAQRKVAGVIAGDSSEDMGLADTRLFQDGRIDRVTFVDDLSRQFLMQAGKQRRAVLNHPHFIAFIEKQVGKAGTCTTATSNHYKHIITLPPFRPRWAERITVRSPGQCLQTWS